MTTQPDWYHQLLAAAGIAPDQMPTWDRAAPTGLHPRSCRVIAPGHGTHWIAALKAHRNTRRRPVAVGHLDDDGWFCLTDGDTSEWRWWHDPRRLRADLTASNGRVLRIGDTDYLTVPLRPDTHRWINTARQVRACDQGRM